jgi:hypothetical protein
MLELTKNRIAAMGLAACLLVYAGSQIGVGQYFVWRIGGYVAFCLGLIWFGPSLGQYTGPRIHETTPGIVVIGMGWLLLLLTPFVICSAKARMALGW